MQPFLRRELGRGRHLEPELEALGRVHPGGEHVVGIAGPGHGLAADRPAMLLEGQHVGQHLAGMRAPGQPVDHRHGGVARELGHRLVVERADHDDVDIAREHAGGVGDGLAAPELHLLPGQHDGLAAELAHGDVERHPRAGRGLVEDHRQRLAFERLALGRARPALAPRLHGAAGVDHPAQLLRGNIDQVEKVAGAVRAHPAAPCRCGACSADAMRAQARSMRRTASATSSSLTISGGSEPHHVIPGRDRDHLFRAQLVDQLRTGHHRAQPDQQPLPAHLGDDGGMAVPDLRELLLEDEGGAA